MKQYLITLLIFFVSCKKDHSCRSCDTDQGYVDAVILNTGPIEVDGCSWVVKIGTDNFYHPDMLKDEFKQNDLNVKICYNLTSDKFVCGIAAQSMIVIHVKDIQK